MENEEKTEEPKTDPDYACVACQLVIPRTATICPHCGSYQRSWMNRLRYLGGVIGLLTFSFAALGYLVTITPEIRKVLLWRDDLRVMEYTQGRYLVLENNGDGDVFVSRMETSMYYPSGENYYKIMHDIYENVPKGQVVIIGDRKKKESLDRYQIIYDVEETVWQEMLSSAKPSGASSCITISVHSYTDPLYKWIKEHYGPGLRSFDGSGLIHFRSVVTGKSYKTESIPLKGLLRVDKSESCVEMLPEHIR